MSSIFCLNVTTAPERSNLVDSDLTNYAGFNIALVLVVESLLINGVMMLQIPIQQDIMQV